MKRRSQPSKLGSRIGYRTLFALGFGALLLVGAGNRRPGESPAPATTGPLDIDCKTILAAQEGDDRLDIQIRQVQVKLRQQGNSENRLERLGWLFVAKARETGNSNLYRLASQCADCILGQRPESLEGLLLRGHVLHNSHRFQEAEEVARKLVAARGAPFDHGLLGDALLEQGDLAEAADAYQKMADLKPGMQSYIRGSQVRWLYGDLEGATTLMRMAAGAAGPRTSEPAAWSYSRLALYELQAGRTEDALDAANTALAHLPDYPPALVARGRILLAQRKADQALESVSKAAGKTHSPEHLWLLADLLRMRDRPGEAAQVEKRLEGAGLAEDPRTGALYLATRGREPDLSMRLASLEMERRQDVFTHDALAWASHLAGRSREAQSAIERALAFGTQDARLFLHAGLIAEERGNREESMRHLSEANRLLQMLFPSEAELLLSARERLSEQSD